MKMFYRSIHLYSTVAAAAFLLSAIQARAQVIDGTLDGIYGSALAIQGNPTGFGNSTIGDGTSAGGSELDAAYGVISGGNLNIFLSGNVEINTGSSGNANHWNVFIATGAPGQSTLNISPSTSAAMNGSTFSPGFQGVLMLDANNFGGTLFVDKVDLTTGPPATASFLGGVAAPGGVGNATVGGITIGINNTNAGGIDGSTATAAAALSVTTGLELSIPLSMIGSPSGPIEVLADVNGSGNGFLSNQFLPGLPPGTGNVGGGGPFTDGSASSFNFGSTPGQFFTVVPEPSTIGLVVIGLLGAMGLRRRTA
jgi:PEP-CTERM motif